MIGRSQSLDSDCVHLTPNCMLFTPRHPPQASRISILGLGLDSIHLLSTCPSSWENRPRAVPCRWGHIWADQPEDRGAQGGSWEPGNEAGQRAGCSADRRGELANARHLPSSPAEALSQGLFPLWAESTCKRKYFSCVSRRLCLRPAGSRLPGSLTLRAWQCQSRWPSLPRGGGRSSLCAPAPASWRTRIC